MRYTEYRLSSPQERSIEKSISKKFQNFLSTSKKRTHIHTAYPVPHATQQLLPQTAPPHTPQPTPQLSPQAAQPYASKHSIMLPIE